MNDQELITAVRQSVHGVHMNVPADKSSAAAVALRAGRATGGSPQAPP